MKRLLLSLLAVAACAHAAVAQCPPQQGWGQPGVSLSVGSGSGWGNQGIQWGINVGNQPIFQNNFPVAYPVAVPQAYPVQYPVAYPEYNAFPTAYPIYQSAYPVCAPRRVYRAPRNRRCR